jgi:hypothetical protein
MSDDANSILKAQEHLAGLRVNFDSWWQEIAYRVLPAQAQFTTTSSEGEKRTERLFDARAVTACDQFASVMDDLLTPRTQQWHMLATEDEDLAESQDVKAFFQELNKRLFSMRYRPQANFASQKHQGYLGVGAFGNSCMFIDEEFSRDYSGPRYRQLHMSEVFWAENHQGVIDTVYRRFKWAAHKAVKRFGNTLPGKIIETAQKQPFQEFEFIHCVKPNDDRMAGRMDHRGMPWASYYIAVEGKELIEHRGYTSWPYAIGRYTIAPNESYARSPAMAAWPAIMTINEEKKTVLRAGQKEVDPPLLLTEDGVLEAFNLRSGALNYGAVSNDGQPLVHPLKIGANIPLGIELMALEKQHIEDSFLVTIFKILAEHPTMTATQVLEITQQKATLLAPVMGRQHSEDLGPLIARELDILAKSGQMPEIPDELLERGVSYKIEYRSPLARAMRAQDGVAVLRTLEVMPTAIGLDPNAAYVIDVPASLREVAEINGMPAKLVRDKRAVEHILQQKQEEDAATAAAAAAPEMSQAALNAAKAEQIRRTPAA